jgi:hypothetical protein
MRRFTACALAIAVLVLGSAALADSGLRSGHGPFVLNDTLNSGSTSGEWGDTSSARTGSVLGCLSRRHYSLAIMVKNRSGKAVTLTGARGPDPMPYVLDRVAIQVRVAPRPTPQAIGIPRPLIKHWSASPMRIVTIPAGRSAIVQSNFLMRHCHSLVGNRRIVVPGSFVLSYRVAGRAGTQHLMQKNAGFSVRVGQRHGWQPRLRARAQGCNCVPSHAPRHLGDVPGRWPPLGLPSALIVGSGVHLLVQNVTLVSSSLGEVR